MESTPRRRWAWIGAANLALAVIFLWLTSGQWIEPELRNDPGARAGGALAFNLICVELLGPMVVLNLAWLFFALRRSARPGERIGAALAFLLAGGGWWALLLFSASRL